ENLENLNTKLLHEFLSIRDDVESHLNMLKKNLNYNSPLSLLNENRQALDYSFRELTNCVNNIMNNNKNTLQQIGNKLNLLSHLSSLERGYNITIDNKSKVIKSISDVEIDEKISLILKDGILNAKVENIKKGEFFDGFK